MAFVSQHLSTEGEAYLSMIGGVTTGSNPAISVNEPAAGTDTIPLKGAGFNFISADDLATWVNSQVLSAVDIDGGTIDGTIIGANSAAAATVTDLTASGTVVLKGATMSTFIATLIDDADQATAQATLGLVIGTDVQAYNSNLTGINQGLATTDSPTFAGLTSTGDVTLTTSDILLNDDQGIFQATSDGSDTGRTILSGGGAIGATRGGFILLSGNEETGNGGRVYIEAGSGADQNIYLASNTSVTGTFSATGTGTFAGVNITGNTLLDNQSKIRWKDLGGTERTALELDENDVFNIGTSAGGGIAFRGDSYVIMASMSGSGNWNLGSGTLTTTGTGTFAGLTVGNLTKQSTFLDSVLTIGTSTAAEQGGIELFGSETTDAAISAVTFNNFVSSTTDKRIAQITALRDGSNDAGALRFSVWSAANTSVLALEINSSGHHDFQAGNLTTTGTGTFAGVTSTGVNKVRNSTGAPTGISADTALIVQGQASSGRGPAIGFDYGSSDTNLAAAIGLSYNSTAGSTRGDLVFLTRNVTTDTAPTIRMTIGSDGDIDMASGNLTTTGTLSVTGTRQWGSYTTSRDVDSEGMTISGGVGSSSGANVILYGGSHPTLTNDYRFRADTTDVYYYDHSATSHTFTGTLTSGAHTLTGDITNDTSVNGDFAIAHDENDGRMFVLGGATANSTGGSYLIMEGWNYSGAGAGGSAVLYGRSDVSLRSGASETEIVSITSTGASITGTLGVSDTHTISKSGASDVFSLVLHNTTATAVAAGVGIKFTQGASGNAGYIFSDREANYSGVASNADSALVFATSKDDVDIVALTLDSSQNATFAGSITAAGVSTTGSSQSGLYSIALRRSGTGLINPDIYGASGDEGVLIGYDSNNAELYIGNGSVVVDGTFDVSGNINANSGAVKSIAGSTSTNDATFDVGVQSVNSSATDNNHSTYGFFNSNSLVDAQIIGKHVSHASRHGQIQLMTHNGTSLLTGYTLDKDQNSTFAGAINLGAFDIQRTIDTDAVTLSGGSDSAVGANLTMFGGTHPTLANDIRFRASATTVYYYDHSATDHAFTGDVTLSAGDLEVTSGDLLLGATSTSNNAQLYATKTYSNSASSDQLLKINATQDTANSSALWAGFFQNNATHTTGTTTSLYGIESRAYASGAGGTTTNAYAARLDVINNNATATITNAFGLFINSFTATGTITNRWGVYQAGASESNYFAGDVRIGTTSPSTHGQESLRIVNTGNRGIALDRSDSDASFIHFTNSTTGDNTTQGMVYGIDSSESGYIWNYQATPIKFATSGTERLRIASDSYAIGIGTTDVKSWDSSYSAIQFGEAAIMGARSGDSIHFYSNAYYDGTERYNTSDDAARVILSGDTQQIFRVASAASGIAGDPVTFNDVFIVGKGGAVFVGDTANTNMTVGLTINQGANDDEIFALKSSDVAHGLTTVSETDTYAAFDKRNSSGGGLTIRSLNEDDASQTTMEFVTYGGTADTTKSASGRSLIEMVAIEHNGANSFQNITSDGNVFGVRGYVGSTTKTLFIVDEDGDTWQSGSVTAVDAVLSGNLITGHQYGACYVTTPAATTISVAGTYYKAAGTTATTNLSDFDDDGGTSNRLRYTGSGTVHVHIAVSVSMTCGSNNQVTGLRVVKNGSSTDTDSVASTVRRKIGTGSDVGSTAVHADIMLTNGDYIELWTTNETSTATVTIDNLYFFGLAMRTV